MAKKGVGASSTIQARHDKRRQKRIREQRIRRYTFFTVLAVIFVLVIMFLTPLFNIRAVSIVGNEKLAKEQISEQIGNLSGRNLFSTRKRTIKRNLYNLPYIKKVDVRKKPFPPTVIVDVEECQPAVQILFDDTFIVIDGTGKILEKSTEKIGEVPVCEGVSITSANEGELIAFKDEEVQKIVMSCIENMKKADIIKEITVMSFADITNITFNYQSRLDAICGTHVDFHRKLALFKEAVNSNKLTQNSRGTINLSTAGKAIYTP